MKRKAWLIAALLCALLGVVADAQHRPGAKQQVTFGVLKRPLPGKDTSYVPADTVNVDSTKSNTSVVLPPP